MSLLDKSDIAFLIFLIGLSSFFILVGYYSYTGESVINMISSGAQIVLGLFFFVVVIVTIKDAYRYWRLEQSYSSDNV